jgi:hypothetical protein
VYFDAGTVGDSVQVDITTTGPTSITRAWNILVTQIGCNDPWRLEFAVQSKCFGLFLNIYIATKINYYDKHLFLSVLKSRSGIIVISGGTVALNTMQLQLHHGQHFSHSHFS